ncbi:MAG: hypothetical protein JWP41_1552 [Ramlibacter sp.]|jgi:hypothetical protein|nr:hypothetical protein [Ramlibacter sp.]
MPNQEQSRDGIPHTDKDRPSPDRLSTDGQASARGSGINTKEDAIPEVPPRAAEEKGVASSADSQSGQDYRGDGPGKIGLTSDRQPDLVAPSGVNDRNPQESGSAPVAGETLNFDDGTDMLHPRGKVTGAGRTRDEKHPSDAGELGAPGAGLSDRNGPSDPDAKRGR